MAVDVRLEDISAGFPARGTVLQMGRLDCPAGTCTGIVGPSGAGKTTLLRVLAGLHKPETGVVRIGHEVMSAGHTRTLGVAMVMQDSAVYPHRTVAGNLRMALAASRRVGLLGSLLSSTRRELRRQEARAIDARVDAVSSLLGLENCRDRRPGEISGGERQRLALGRALVTDPDVLLLDEPFSDLDPPLRDDLQSALDRVRAHRPMTVVLVTHDLDDALRMADTIVILADGRVHQVGPPEDILAHPADDVVSRVLGARTTGV
jgi:ABC-type sugar transport system ATPase subunit